MLIEEVKSELPDLRVVIMESFVLPGSGTAGTLEDGSDKYEIIRSEVEKRAAAARRVAEKFQL